MNDYEERKAARIDRLKELAEKRRAEAEALDQRGRKMSEVIPLGQPILVGHHLKSSRADQARSSKSVQFGSLITQRPTACSYSFWASRQKRSGTS